MGKVNWSGILMTLLLALTAAAWPDAARGDDGGQPQVLEDVLVEASGVTDDAFGQSVIGQEVLERPTFSGTVVDSLLGQAGLQVMGSSLLNAKQTAVRLRGFDETRFRVLLDGMPIQRDGSYGNGPVDWSMFSPEAVEKIEIFRGGVPAKFGDTLGGVINIISKKPTDKPVTRVQAAYGSFDTQNYSADHRWRKGPVGWSLSAGHYQTAGYLRNNQTDRDNLSGQLTLDLPWAMEAGGSIFYSDGATGLPVYNQQDSPYFNSDYPQADAKELGGPGIGSRLLRGVYGWGDNSEIEDVNTTYAAYLKKNFAAGELTLKGLIWNQRTTETYYNGSDSSKLLYQRDTTPEDNNWQVMADYKYTLGDHVIEAGGLSRTYGWGGQSVPYLDRGQFSAAINYFSYVSQGFEGQPDCLQTNALYVQDSWQALDNLSFELGLRAEWFKAKEIDPAAFGFPASAAVSSISDNSADPRLAIRYNPWEGGEIAARVGIAHRYPNSPEYFWWYLNRGSGYFNTDLNPEKAAQYEIGLEQKIGQRAVLAARAYYYKVDDYLASTTVSGVGTVVYNIDEVDISGAELEAAVMLPWNLRLWGNLTIQDADKSGDPWDKANQAQSQLPDFPETMANLGLDYRLAEKLNVGLTLHFVGQREYISGKKVHELDSYTLLNAHASYSLADTDWGKWELIASAENMLDQDYEQEAGYPMPGVVVLGGLRFLY